MYAETVGCIYADVGCIHAEAVGCIYADVGCIYAELGASMRKRPWFPPSQKGSLGANIYIYIPIKPTKVG